MLCAQTATEVTPGTAMKLSASPTFSPPEPLPCLSHAKARDRHGWSLGDAWVAHWASKLCFELKKPYPSFKASSLPAGFFDLKKSVTVPVGVQAATPMPYLTTCLRAAWTSSSAIGHKSQREMLHVSPKPPLNGRSSHSRVGGFELQDACARNFKSKSAAKIRDGLQLFQAAFNSKFLAIT